MDNTQGLGDISGLAIVNYGTGRHLKVVNGSLATVQDTSGDDNYRVVGAGEADETLQTIINQPSVEAANSIPQRTITPKEENSEIFYITDPQSETCLRDAGSGSEVDPISTETFTTSSEHDDTRLWRVLAVTAADNLTPIDDTIKYARPAMELLLSQWQDNTIVYTPKKPVATVASIDKNDIKTLKKGYPGMKKKEEDALLNGGVRIDRQGFIEKKKVYFANMQGQVSTKSVWQVNVQTGQNFGAAAISAKMAESMNAKPPKEIWMEK